MKQRTLFIAIVLLAFFAGNNSQAQNANENQNYVVFTKKIPQLQPILLAAEQLKIEDGENFGEFEIIICGQEIGDITDPDKINKFITKAEKLGVTIVACGFSLNKFKVDRQLVPKQMKTVENGILYNLQLQKQGYHSLGL